VRTGAKPFNMAVSCDEKTVMSSNAGSNDVSFVDVASLTEVARVSIMGPVSTAQYDTKVTQRLNPRISPDCKYLWVGNQAAGTFAVLDIAQRKLVGEVRAAEKGGGSDIMFFIGKGPAAGLAIGTNRYSPFATVINPKPPFNVIKRISAGMGTHYVWLNADSTEAYVSSRIEGSFSIFDLASLKEVARKGGFKPIDQTAYISFNRKVIASSVGESGDAK
jgi:DNA-binding beta-propeller fold protein YncE